MGGDFDREAAIFFQKNPSNLDASGEFLHPSHSSGAHHEIELVVAL
jgi:fumarylpyruvate hydrolase